MNKLKINVVIPNFNNAKYITETIESVFANTYDNFDVTVVDDKSSDNSIEIIKELKKKYQLNLIAKETNTKLSDTRNVGIRATSGELILCLDSDDVIPTNYMSECVTLIESGYDIVYCNSRCFGSKNDLYNWPEYSLSLLQQTPFVNCSAIYKREVFERNQYDVSMIYGWEDYDFWLSAAKNGFKFKKCNSTELHYRMKENNMTVFSNSKEGQQLIRNHLRLKHKNFYMG